MMIPTELKSLMAQYGVNATDVARGIGAVDDNGKPITKTVQNWQQGARGISSVNAQAIRNYFASLQKKLD